MPQPLIVLLRALLPLTSCSCLDRCHSCFAADRWTFWFGLHAFLMTIFVSSLNGVHLYLASINRSTNESINFYR
jgi:hypothetical protein